MHGNQLGAIPTPKPTHVEVAAFGVIGCNIKKLQWKFSNRGEPNLDLVRGKQNKSIMGK